MNIVILSQNPRLYSTKRLVEAGIAHGHNIEVIDPLKCFMDITSGRPIIHYNKRTLEEFDAVIPRIGLSITSFGLAVLRQFEMMGIYPLNESVAIGRSRDKLRSLQILSREGLGMPTTAYAHSTKMTEELIKLVGGAPLVVKLLEGTQGKGVVLAETDQAAKSVIDAFRELDADILVQEFIKEAKGSDLRCFVVGNKVVASMIRTAKEGEFRSNLHRGGTASQIELTDEERKSAILSAKALGLNVAGVDILRSNKGPKIIEVNASPGLEGVEKTTGIDVAGLVMEYLEKNARAHATGTKGKG